MTRVICTSASIRPALAFLLVAAGTLLAALAGCARGRTESRQPDVSYAEARAVVDRHCVSCHSERPTIPAFPIAPNGTTFDTADELRRHAAAIRLRTVVDRSMPLLNKTGMTETERATLGRWIDAGARVPERD